MTYLLGLILWQLIMTWVVYSFNKSLIHFEVKLELNVSFSCFCWNILQCCHRFFFSFFFFLWNPGHETIILQWNILEFCWKAFYFIRYKMNSFLYDIQLHWTIENFSVIFSLSWLNIHEEQKHFYYHVFLFFHRILIINNYFSRQNINLETFLWI